MFSLVIAAVNLFDSSMNISFLGLSIFFIIITNHYRIL